MTQLRLVEGHGTGTVLSRGTAAAIRRRVGGRWRTRFGSFIDLHTVNGLLDALRERGVPLNKFTLYKWISGDATPRIESALVLRDLSRGSLTLDDIYDHRALVRDLELLEPEQEAA